MPLFQPCILWVTLSVADQKAAVRSRRIPERRRNLSASRLVVNLGAQRKLTITFFTR